MTPLKILIAAATFWVAFFVPPAHAQMMCFMAPYLPNFKNNFGEEPIANGSLGNGEEKIILFVNQTTGTWTIVIDKSDEGLFCPFISGKDFKLIKPKLKGQDIRWNPKL